MRRRDRGQALVEFALVLPLMLAMLVGVLDLGRVIWAWDSVSNAAREGARCAIVSGLSLKPGGAGCPQLPKDRARDLALGAGNNVTVTMCYSLPGGPSCTGDTPMPGANNERGSLVTVRVQAQLDLFAPKLIGMSGFTVAGHSTMVVCN